MARRRLTPSPAPQTENVPRAEHFALEHKSLARFSPHAPIAHVAADAAGTAALEEMARSIETARETGRMILDLPLDAIAPDHLTRDRLPVEDGEMAALRDSIRAHGQRTPVEVTRIDGSLPWGLISGWRRLLALKSLHDETGEARFATIQAILRKPDTVADAYVNMVEENEIRVGLSHYERARVAALATQRGIFESEKKALLALFANASRAKRSRIRSFLEIYHALDPVLRFPAHLPERLGLQLVDLIRDGGVAKITHALALADPTDSEAELAALSILVTEQDGDSGSDAVPVPKRTAPMTARPRLDAPVDAILPGVTLEQSLKRGVLTLRLRGDGVTPELAAEIRTLLAGLSRSSQD